MFSRNKLTACFEGVMLAALVFLVCSGVVPLLFVPARAQTPLFSVTLTVSSSNQVRQQYAKDLANDMIAEGINAKLMVVNFDQLFNREFFMKSAQGATYANGGYDMGFIGWGFTSPVPDFRSNLYGAQASFAPAGNNWALYNNLDVNGLFDQLYSSTDTAKQISMMRQVQKIVFRDKPYNYVYEAVDAVPRDQKWMAWGGKDVYSVLTFPDVQQWSGGDQLTFAEAARATNFNPVQTSSSNSFYSLYIYGAIMYSGAGLQDADARSLSFYPALATSIQSSPDALDWTVKIRQGVLFQSGVEVTADDFVWTQWAMTNPKSASAGLGGNIEILGNVVDFTFLDGTMKTIDNRASASEVTRHGSWKAVDKYTFQFHLPAAYAFTKQTYAAFSPLPKHILEKYAPETWNNIPFSTASQPTTYTWDTSKYGGSGSYTVVGPVGAGPYYLESYDSAKGTATLKKFHQYWNATGLEALGRFTVETYQVMWIDGRNAAIDALKSGKVDVLDSNYGLAQSEGELRLLGLNVVSVPELGWQEQGFNMKHPVFGTGAETPLGKSEPSKAAEAARHVRTAISHLIRRDHIVNDLLGGSAYPLATCIGPGWGAWYDPDLIPDTYDLGAAADELRAAGYNPLVTATASVTSTVVSTTTSTIQPTTSVGLTTTGGNRQSTTLSSTQTETITQPFSLGQSSLMVVAAVVLAAVVVGLLLVYRSRSKKSGSKPST